VVELDVREPAITEQQLGFLPTVEADVPRAPSALRLPVAELVAHLAHLSGIALDPI
jgi:hypothetical protein